MRRALDGLYDACAALAACFMVGLLAAVLLSVLGRQLHFNIPGIDAYAGYLMAGAGFLSLAHTLKRGEHIRVTLLIGRLTGGAQRAMELWALFAATRARGFLDVNLREFPLDEDVLRWSLGRAEVAKLNAGELLRVAEAVRMRGNCSTTLGKGLIDAFGIRWLLVTEGANGAWLLDDCGARFNTPPTRPPASLRDSVGAGDAFAAVVMLGLLHGWDVGECLERGNRLAADVCGLRGAVPDDGSFYDPFMADWGLQGGAAS